MSLQMSPRMAATLLIRLAGPRLTPVAKAAAKHERQFARVFLRAIREAQAAVPMGDLEDALTSPGTGGPLYIMSPVLEALLEDTPMTGGAYFRKAAKKEKIADVLKETMKDGAEAVDVCVPARVFDAARPAVTHAEKLDEVKQMQAALAEMNVRIKTLPTMNATTEAGQRNINATHTALKSMSSAREKLSQAGLSEKSVLKVKFKTSAEDFVAQASQRSGNAIEINLKHPIWQSPEHLASYAQNDFATGWGSSASADRYLTHEVGHVLHFKTGQSSSALSFSWVDGKGPEQALQAARKVSRYAMTNAHEFVAETFSALVDGKRFDDEVMALYKELNGPMLKGMK